IMIDTLKLKWRQYLSASLASYGSLCTGMSMGWTSPVLPQLRGPNSPLAEEPTLQQESWIGSLLVLGGLFGPLITVPPVERGGAPPACSLLPYLYILGRLLRTRSAAHSARCSFYLSTSASCLLMLSAPFPRTGGLLPPVVSSRCFTCRSPWCIPESPFFLVYKGRNEEASNVLRKLRGTSKEAVQQELEGLQAMIAREFKEEPRIRDLWATRGNLKALGICVFLAMLLQLSGIDVLLFYMEELLVKVGSTMSPAHGTIIMGVVQVVTSCVTPLVVDRLGRKLLMWTTSLGLTIFLALIGVYAVLDSHFKVDVAHVAFIPLLCLIVYMILFTLGVGPVPWILVAEMFPVKTKCLASGIASFMCWLAGFIWTRFFREVAASYGIYTAFWILAVCCGFGFIFSATLLPETKGKTFDEIQEMLNKGSNKQEVKPVDV
ncbi:hypothetical protein ACJJTC_014156, partial [Scirpophaga incertulas]